jgi:hypothetical protein
MGCHLMMTLAAGRFTPAASVLVAASMRSAPLLNALSTITRSSWDRSAARNLNPVTQRAHHIRDITSWALFFAFRYAGTASTLGVAPPINM